MHTKLDKNSPVPLHHQLKRLIKEHIDSGKWQPGAKLPTEEEFCQWFGISRTPLRQALSELAHEGWIRRYRRRGTFVSERVPPATLEVLLPDRRWLSPLRRAADRLGQTGSPLELRVHVVGYERLHDELVRGVARGKGPDLVLLDSVWLAELASLGFLYPLEELDPDWVERCRTDVYPVLLDSNRYQGKLYGLQAETDVSLIWYRKDWLEREGLTAPNDWTELSQLAEHFRRAVVRRRYGIEGFPLAFAGGTAAGEATTYQFLSFVLAQGPIVPPRGRGRVRLLALSASGTASGVGLLGRARSPRSGSSRGGALPLG